MTIDNHPCLVSVPPSAQLARSVSICVLGRFEVRVADVPIRVQTNVARVLALLAVEARPLTRSEMSAVLWADASPKRTSANLRSALWRARSDFGEVIETVGNTITLVADVNVDIEDLRRSAHSLMHDGHAAIDWPCPVLVSELLPGWDEEWLLFERERVRQLSLHALEALCRRLSAAGRHGEAIDAAMYAVAADPLRETGQRVLIEAHLREGNVSEARRQFELYRSVLLNRLGIAPSRSLERLVSGETADVVRFGTGRSSRPGS
ncbi:AfsR/SARP family transcriptional regulator [Frankia sp. Cr1]|uniref:AfsR/SARP family transcriptional regulator n=1 Tax=Frankia sp. Cr1 TaxID=3073931 RepID=UPI002AD20A74|nr:BTAD domain-containing putative transcriptional regulator [Frankia sp. Cr1]